jgi:succinate dehydrogenase flavin-adding protein (antitoxin of CptAB toxin-antitoxin module)
MVSVANKTIKSYIETLNESEREELKKLLSEDDSKLSSEFEVIKEDVVSKLTEMKNASTDTTMQNRIDETLTKVLSEKYDKLTYFKLKGLKENL